jgi:hypothetical protein
MTTCPPVSPQSVAVGTFANISLNNMSAVDPCPAGTCIYSEENRQEGVFVLWNGGAWAPNYSQLGAMLFHGGGHSGYAGNEVYAFDLTTLKWVRHKNPSLYNESSIGPNGEYPDGQPFPPHTFGGTGYLPPPYGGARGAFIRFGFSGISLSQWMHKMVLSSDPTADSWVRFGPAPITSTNSYNAVTWDTTRNVFWLLGGGTSTLTQVDTNGNLTVTGAGTNVQSTLGLCYSPALDLLVALGTDAQGKPHAYVRAGGASSGTHFSDVPLAGTAPPDVTRNGLRWSTILKCFVTYPGNGSYTVYLLTPPASSPLTGTWTWSSQTLTGVGGNTPIVANYTSQYNGNWGRFVEIPAWRGFLYADGANNSVQFWRLNGMG